MPAPRSRTPVSTHVRAHGRRQCQVLRQERGGDSHDESSSVALAVAATAEPGHCGISGRSASNGMEWAASAIISGARMDVRDGCLRCVREVSLQYPSLPWPAAVQVASRSAPFASSICVSGTIREVLAVSLRSQSDVRVLLTQTQGAAVALEEVQGPLSLVDQLIEVSTQAEPQTAASTACAYPRARPQLSRGRVVVRRDRERLPTSRGQGGQVDAAVDNHSLAWHQAKMPLSDVFMKITKKLGNLLNAATASVETLDGISSRQPESLALNKYTRIVAACDELGSGQLGLRTG